MVEIDKQGYQQPQYGLGAEATYAGENTLLEGPFDGEVPTPETANEIPFVSEPVDPLCNTEYGSGLKKFMGKMHQKFSYCKFLDDGSK